MKFFAFLLLLFVATAANGATLQEFLESNAGDYTFDRQKFYEFEKIKYGVVEKRFAAPKPVEGYSIDYGCEGLCLSVYSKNVTENYPVIVYVQGVNLVNRPDVAANGHVLLSQDVVLVTVEYRLGAEGFLSTNTDDVPGNAGVLDIILALKWVQQHIHDFGGDPHKVTVMGQYKVAGLIGILTMSPLAENLFHNVIYQSGSPLMANLTTTDPLVIARKVAEKNLCTDFEDPAKLNECLLTSGEYGLDKAYEEVAMELNGDVAPITIGGPSNVLPGTETPAERVKSGHFRKFPTIGGCVTHPAVYIEEVYTENDYSPFSVKHFDEEIAITALLTALSGELDTDKTTDILSMIAEHDDEFYELLQNYMQASIRGRLAVALPKALDEIGLEIKKAVFKFLEANSEGGAKSYLYAFKESPHPVHAFKKPGNLLKNYVTIGDDLFYLFPTLNDEKMQHIPPNTEVSKFLAEVLSSFATTGVPDAHELYKWPALNHDTWGPYVAIAEEPYVAVNYMYEYYSFLPCLHRKGCEWIDDTFLYSHPEIKHE